MNFKNYCLRSEFWKLNLKSEFCKVKFVKLTLNVNFKKCISKSEFQEVKFWKLLSHVWLNQVSIQATNIHTQASNIHTKSPPITLIEAISTLKLVCVPCQFKIQNNDGLRICFTCCRNECQSMILNYFL